MSAYASGLNYDTVSKALTGATETSVLIVGSTPAQVADAPWIDVLSIIVTDSTGSVATAAKVTRYDASETANHVLAPSGIGFPTASQNLEIVAEPCIHLERSDEIRVTGASGHHVLVTFIKGVAGGSSAQGVGTR